MKPRMQIGGRYNWRNQPERLIYLGKNWSGNGYWHQFALTSKPDEAWCEVPDEDLECFEETPPEAPKRQKPLKTGLSPRPERKQRKAGRAAMKHHTDAERADFEAWARSRYPSIDLTRDGGGYSKALAKDYWSLWQAARRAPTVPVPLRKPTIDQVADAVGYHDSAWDCVDPSELIDAILMLAAAPKPPEAAPVQLPEPVAKIFFDRKCCEVSELPAWENLRPYGTHELVSVHQVRELLADHGITQEKQG